MPVFQNLAYDTAHLLDTGVLVLSFALLYQRRLFGVIKIYAQQALLLAAAAAWQAHAQEAPHLYITAGIALVFKAMVIPIALHRIIVYLNIHRTLETA
ncbi:MAG TPA: hydrogenase-4 component E, partial [Stellaceae bacterium]|nr:hydrogenase-4 component E [Stellaceae bacterium]